ncbi:PREDICTED: uncharacterized protein LOC105362070 isoform X2 [Ceratosolen solmsi marchali]|uniref:Uncharacterized protein LOC105362070 isoform X2 n=1 Tax=Ceratosolen solmsi marchali TaxID=326594 RepID=A0AAJ6YGM2_9HYME|nr:PREDICTED: uncharacterized protein LOC105362070 isoform X2 [Ceratosolen solmsi marchali]
MYWLWLALCLASAAVGQYDGIEPRSVAYPSKSNLGPLYSSFSGPAGYRDNSYEDNAVTPTPSPTPIYRNSGSAQQLYRKPSASIDASREFQHQTPVRISQQRGPIRVGPQQFSKNGQLEEELEEEKDEPDRLSLLLPQSKFDCVGKQTGYYADEELNCEVFHYCQDNAKHSWICPEGFTFHQVHLICMPPNGDITCKKSSQYHFVNEYLYKPLNLDEAENKPNVTLRYSERYFPSDIYTDERENNEYRASSSVPARRPVYLAQQPIPTINSLPTGGRPQPSPSTTQYRIPVNQVFRSPEEVNIPLQQRRPQLQSPQGLRRFPQVRPDEEDYE